MISTFPKLSRKQKQKSFQIFIQPISSVVVIKVLEKEPTLFALCNMYGLLPNNPLSELSLLMRNDWGFKTDILTQSPTNYKKHNGVFLCRTFTFKTQDCNFTRFRTLLISALKSRVLISPFFT